MANLRKFIPIVFLLLAHFNTIRTTSGAVLDSESEVTESELDAGIEDLDGRINYLANKTIKILIGQAKPSVQVSQTQQMQNVYQQHQMQNQQQQLQNVYQQQQQQGYNPNYPNSPNYPVSPGDLSGQGSGPQPNYEQKQPQQSSEEKPPTGIPEIYLQIVGAIEKLVGRMDKLETRLKTVENIVYHMTSNKKDEPQKGSCPDNFVKIDGIRGKCYHVSAFDEKPSIFDWKSAHAQCSKLGGRLVEMIHYDDFLRISQFLVKYGKSKDSPAGSSDYWVGGINPGLIWIWTESGQQVGMDRRFWNENDNSSNAPGCLKLSYSHRLDAFFFKGAPCSHSQNVLCEVMDNTVSRALATFEQTLWTEDSLSSNTTDD